MTAYGSMIAYDVWNNKGSLGRFARSITGRNQYENTKKSVATQIAYNDYIKAGNQRAYDDWMRNVGKYGRTIRYPELSYPGRIYQADTASARAMYDADTAYANYSGNLPFRIAGLYGIGSRVSRWL